MSDKEIVIVESEKPLAQIDPILAMIEQATALDKVDVSKVEALMGMYYKNQDRQARKEFMEDFANLQGEIPRVVAKKENKQTNSSYAAIEDINKIVQPYLTQYGFGILFKAKEQTEAYLTIEATLTHKSGYSEATELKMPLDDVGIAGKTNKTKVHGTGSAMTYAKRYALCAILNISVGGEDVDGNIPLATINEAQLNEISALLDDSGIDKIKFIEEYLKTDSLKNLPAKNYDKAVRALKKRIQDANS